MDEITPCCYFKPEYMSADKRSRLHRQQPLEQYLAQVNNDPEFTYQDLRKTACTRCDFFESTYGYRQRFGRHTVSSSHRGRGDERIPADMPVGKIAYLDVMFSNFCNHACVYCDSSSSNLWNDTARVLRPTHAEHTYMSETNEYNTLDKEREMIDLILSSDLSHLRYVAIKGGEPFLSRLFDEFMRELGQRCDLSRVAMTLTTNNSIWPRQAILDTFSKLRHFNINISGESIGELAEYVRYGTDWDGYESNTRKWMEYEKLNDNTRLYFQSTANVLTINRVSEWLQWLSNMGINSQDTNWPTQAWGSQDFRQLLTRRQAKTLHKRYRHLPHAQWRDFLLKNLDPVLYPDLRPEMTDHYVEVMSQMERFRGNSLQKVNSEMHSWLFT